MHFLKLHLHTLRLKNRAEQLKTLYKSTIYQYLLHATGDSSIKSEEETQSEGPPVGNHAARGARCQVEIAG